MRLIASLLTLAALIVGCGDAGMTGFSPTPIATPAGPESAMPHLDRSADGTVVLSWLEGPRDDVTLRFSTLEADTWQPARTIARGAEWFVNWADFPSVSPISTDRWAAHWLPKRPGGIYSYDVAVSLSQDRGASWGVALTPHTDGTPTEHGFVTLFPWQNRVGVLWLDGRNTTGEGEPHNEGEGHNEGGDGGMTLRVASIAPDRTLHDEQVVDELVCDCCQTDVSAGTDGPIAVYRDRTENEIRDIYVSRAVDGRWQPGVPVHNDGWKIAGCPVNGPAIASTGRNVAVAWFTAAGDTPRVRVSLSGDDAKTFGEPVDLHTRTPLGRVDVEWLDDGVAVVSWLEKSGMKQAELCIRTVSADGELGPLHVVASTAASRPSGFPQMIRADDRLIFAWTAIGDDISQIKTAAVSAEKLR
ncbi:MAG: exo-alpha-sialidase [Gammaproteobacteria bacterium]|nr:exo-alpha-sialidase [Gammaproteobacteria bacterium]MDH3768202.1 exo-alpha-sialidase [Gammaproteobacteria bacterium]